MSALRAGSAGGAGIPIQAPRGVPQTLRISCDDGVLQRVQASLLSEQRSVGRGGARMVDVNTAEMSEIKRSRREEGKATLTEVGLSE
jgi:hypothetical protein